MTLPRLRRGGRGQQGFTLLELLLAITILGLIMSALSGGLQFGARVWERGVARAEELTDLGVAQGILRRLLSRAYPMAAAGTVAEPQVVFSGAPEQVVFVGLAPAELAMGGFYRFSLHLAETGHTQSLMLGWQPFRPEDDAPGHGDSAQETVLLEGVEAVSFAYYDAGDAAWRADWTQPARLPALVRIRIAFADRRRPQPELVIRPMIDLDAAALTDIR